MSAVINDIDIDLIALLILVFIYANTTKRAEHAFTQHKLFLMLIGTLSFLLAFDGISRVADGMPGAGAYYVNWASNLLLFAGVPLVPGFWMLYADFQIFHDEKRLKRYRFLLWGYLAVNGLITVASVFTGWFFTVDANNIYHRGPLFLLNPSMSILLLLYTLYFIASNRNRIDRKHLASMLLFALPPLIGGVLQSMFYGLSLIQTGLALSALLLHFSIQDKRLDTDYLTGVFNRRLLDSYLVEKVTRSIPFSAILIDLDGFKAINDTHGHVAGDNALLDAVKILRGCLREGDFIARYGGDEFFVALDIGEEAVLVEKVRRIRSSLAAFNESSGRPYSLSFSVGYAVYQNGSGQDARGFLKRLDLLLYEDKKRAVAAKPETERVAGAQPC